MTTLVDWQIKELLTNGPLKITPFDPELIQPASLDVRLGYSFKYKENGHIKSIELPYDTEELVEIKPLKRMLANTLEYFEVPDNISITLCGKSSIGRKGLFIENAGFVDAGFFGTLTLELFNTDEESVFIKPGKPIGQIRIEKHNQCAIPYNIKGHYCDQQGATESIFKDNKLFMEK